MSKDGTGAVVMEQELDTICPEHVLRLNWVTENYLCKPEDNVYSIDFTRSKIRDLETETVLFEIVKPCISDQDQDAEEESVDMDFSMGRFVQYQFTPAFLRLRTISAAAHRG